MATLQKRRSDNVSGNFYVDSSCIDCDTCRWMAPTIFNRSGPQSAVYHQPVDSAERQKALQALLSCPTASIGTVNPPKDIKAAQQTFPIVVEDNVFHCGYHAENSFAASSYFIQHAEGNILIDSPRFSPPLVKQLEKKGGVRYLYLTHRDDVADHAKFQQHFNCERILHQDDISEGTRDVEIQLTGTENIQLTEDILIIPVPGHTQGHTVLLYRDKFLFSGDHLAWSAQMNHLNAFRRYCWYSWEEQIRSMEKLTTYSFEWLLPGHGRRYHASISVMRQKVWECIAEMKATH